MLESERTSMYPRILINKKHLVENVKEVLIRAQREQVSVTAVTKCIAGNREIAEAYVEAGITKLGDSRIHNLKKLQTINCEKWLIRIPMLSECSEVVRYADVSLNSEMDVIRRLNEEAKKQDVVHKVILMIDVGDLREGIFLGTGEFISSENTRLADSGDEMIRRMIEEILGMQNLELYGLGINSTCFGATIPVPETYKKVLDVAEWLEHKHGIPCQVISGGNSSCYYLFDEGKLPEGINNMRLGELLLLGQETAYLKPYAYLHQDNFILETEIVELKEKPSYPEGLIGLNSFGEKVEFEDKGTRKRAIVAIGKQDVLLEHLNPIDTGISIEGGSSDHMIIDTTESARAYKVGDIVRFSCDYASVLALCTSEYVESKII